MFPWWLKMIEIQWALTTSCLNKEGQESPDSRALLVCSIARVILKIWCAASDNILVLSQTNKCNTSILQNLPKRNKVVRRSFSFYLADIHCTATVYTEQRTHFLYNILRLFHFYVPHPALIWSLFIQLPVSLVWKQKVKKCDCDPWSLMTEWHLQTGPAPRVLSTIIAMSRPPP